MKQPVEYRRVRDSEDEDEPYLRNGQSNNTCILSTLLLLLIILSISLAVTFYITSRTETLKQMSTLKNSTDILLQGANQTGHSETHSDTSTTSVHTHGESHHHGGESDRKTTTEISTGNNMGHSDHLGENGTLVNTGHNETQEEANLREHLVKLMRKYELFMENFTGMEGELLVPLMMLFVFLTSLTLVSLCCCFMSKRREARRRKLFGKIITDLQTGDSKTVLLNQSDLDD